MSFWKDKTVLVTGGYGFVGVHVVKMLKQKKCKVVHVPSKYDYNCTIEREVDLMFQHLKPDVVIHLAARVGGIQDNILRPAEYFDDNILINTNVLKMSKIYGVDRFIGMLSTCVYPDFGKLPLYPLQEKHLLLGPPAPTNFSYSYAKRCMAIQIDAYNQQYNTKYSYLIPCNLYSEYDNFDNKNKMHFVTALLKKIKTSKETLNLLGTGRPLRQFIYAGDLARVIKEVIDKDIVEDFNVAPSYNYSIKKMAQIALNVTNKNLKIEYSNPELDGQYRKDVSSERMKSILPNFKLTSFEEGIKKVYAKI